MVLISSCLAGCPVRYDGRASTSKEVLELMNSGEDYILICPELLGGMSVPREPSEISGGNACDVINGNACVINIKGEDVTAFFLNGAKAVLDMAMSLKPQRIYLKSKSPSCGLGEVYDGSFSGELIQGNGICAELLRKNGFEVISI